MKRGSVLVAALGFAACSGGPPRDVTLVVHASLPEEVLEHAEAIFEADFDSVDVRFVTATEEETLTALRSADEQVDVWWGAAGVAMETAADEGLLDPYRPPWLGQPGVGQPDPEGRWQVSLVSPFVIAFNRERVPIAEAPRDWIDLFHHGWAGEIDLIDPLRDDDMAHFLSAMIVERLRDQGDDLAGFDWLERLHRSVGEYVSDVEDVMIRLRGGQALLTVLPRHEVEARRHDDAPWLYYRIPESGAPLLSRGVAIASTAAHPELARIFVNLTGTRDVATEARRHTRWMPGHGDVDTAALPEDFEIDVPWTPLQMAPDTIARERAGWLDRWELEVRAR